MGGISEILISSNKAELLELIEKELVTTDKVIVILVEDKDEGKFASQVLALGLKNHYEAYGILEVAKQDLQNDSKAFQRDSW